MNMSRRYGDVQCDTALWIQNTIVLQCETNAHKTMKCKCFQCWTMSLPFFFRTVYIKQLGQRWCIFKLVKCSQVTVFNSVFQKIAKNANIHLFKIVKRRHIALANKGVVISSQNCVPFLNTTTEKPRGQITVSCASLVYQIQRKKEKEKGIYTNHHYKYYTCFKISTMCSF